MANLVRILEDGKTYSLDELKKKVYDKHIQQGLTEGGLKRIGEDFQFHVHLCPADDIAAYLLSNIKSRDISVKEFVTGNVWIYVNRIFMAFYNINDEAWHLVHNGGYGPLDFKGTVKALNEILG